MPVNSTFGNASASDALVKHSRAAVSIAERLIRPVQRLCLTAADRRKRQLLAPWGKLSLDRDGGGAALSSVEDENVTAIRSKGGRVGSLETD
jgi:hypothetical protein